MQRLDRKMQLPHSAVDTAEAIGLLRLPATEITDQPD